MAKEAKAEPGGADTAPPKKSKKLLIIIAGVLVILLAVGGAAAFFLMSKSGAEDGENEEAVTEPAKTSKKKGKEVLPVYVPLDAFTVNLVPESGEQFLQVVLSVEVADVITGDKVKTFTPKIRNNVMMLLSGKKASELLTKEGKEKLAGEIRDQMNTVLGSGNKDGEGAVREVLFTSFIIQ